MGYLKVLLRNISIRHFCNDNKPTIMKYLNVAEKNDAAKTIAGFLSRGSSQRREGLSPYNKIYEFKATVFGQQCQMVMTSVSGHLLTYEFVTTYRGWNSCNPVVLFDAPVIKSCPENYMKIKKTLEREIRSCQGLIIWTDCDREGENIGYEIIKVCQEVKSNLRIYRAKFSEITAASINRAISNLGQPNKNVSDAVDVRQELDLRTGAAFTRLQTLRLTKVFPQSLDGKLISYGSCQFPTLGFVVERYKEIENFIPEQFWRIKMNHTIKDLTVDYHWNRDRLFDKNSCEAIMEICQENPTATVEHIESKPKSKWRPLPLDTVEMEKNISRKLRINAKETMKIAEKLYTQGFISYPRTETNIFPKELNLVPLVEQQRDDNRWGDFAQRILNEGGPNPRHGKKSDQAHPPIHPTKYTNSLSGNEQRVYEYIVRHFLACVQKDALGHETVVRVDIANEKFTAKGLMILERNYLDVYTYEKWNAKEVHQYQQGDTFTPSELEMVESSTTAPKLLTEADLIALMEKHGIGTDATHAEHIDTIKAREYVGLHDNMYFVPGTLGMGLVEGYNNIGLEVSLAKPILRAEFENDLKLISDGVKTPDEVRREQIAKYRTVFQTVVDKMVEIDQSLANRLNDTPQPVATDDNTATLAEQYRPVLKCPKCRNDMILRNRKNNTGLFLSCVGYPSCKNAIWFGNNIESVEVLNESCESCGNNTKKLKIKFKQNCFPGEPNPNILCIGGCDTGVLDALDINVSNVRVLNINQANELVNRRISTGLTNLNNSHGSSTARLSNSTNTRINQSNSTSTSSNARPQAAASRSSNVRPNPPTNNSINRPNLLPTVQISNPQNNYNAHQTFVVNEDNVSSDTIVCNCNQQAVLLTVRKEGPNKGRQFYKCSRGNDGGGCNFFLWSEEANNSNNPSNRPSTSNIIKCNCNTPAVLRTVSKDGPNKGRQFYSCSKSREESCGFFKWLEDAEAEAQGNNRPDDFGGGGGGGRRNSSGGKWKKPKAPSKRNEPYSSTQSKTKRKCGICHQEGHNRKNCPNS